MIINVLCEVSSSDNSVSEESQMNELEIAKKLLSLIEAKDNASALKLLSDDFTFSGPVPEPISGPMWLGMVERLIKAFPDWAYNVSDLKLDGDIVHLTVHISGTHKGELDLSNLDFPKVPATGKKIQLPRDETELKIEGGKVKYFKTSPNPEAGVSGILKQLGVAVPDQSMA
jgi:predicted ester cyclase